jgi:hypothetical protein
MRNIWKAVENATNIAVIVFVCLAAVFFYRTYEDNRPEVPQTGATLPALAGYSWQSTSQSLVLALRKGCHFCEESMPFYRKLYDLEKSNSLKVKMVAVFPDTTQDAYEVLSTQSLPIPCIPKFSLSSLSVSGTPTLILVDQTGRVEKAWIGKLDSQGEENVLAAIQKPSP